MPTHTMNPVDSSMLSHEGYDANAQELHVTFHNKTNWAYPCSPEKYAEFQKAESKGRWINANIDKKAGRKIG